MYRDFRLDPLRSIPLSATHPLKYSELEKLVDLDDSSSIFLYTLLSLKNELSVSSLEELKERVRRLEERVKALEEELDSLLTADDLRALKEAEEEYRKGETILHEELVKKLLEES